jgi:V-type H+-transporting ATPase subunit d
MNIEIMRNTLYKAYLEDFYKFCQVSSTRDGGFDDIFHNNLNCSVDNSFIL